MHFFVLKLYHDDSLMIQINIECFFFLFAFFKRSENDENGLTFDLTLIVIKPDIFVSPEPMFKIILIELAQWILLMKNNRFILNISTSIDWPRLKMIILLFLNLILPHIFLFLAF